MLKAFGACAKLAGLPECESNGSGGGADVARMSAGAKRSASELAVVDSWPAGASSKSGQSIPARLSSRYSTSSSDVVEYPDDSRFPENFEFVSLLHVLFDTSKVVSVCFLLGFSIVLSECSVVDDILLVGILVTCVFNGKVVKLPGGSLFF